MVKSFYSQFLKLTKYAKCCLHKTINCENFTQLICFIISWKIGETLWLSTKCQITKVSRRLCQVKTQTLVVQTILEKISGEKYRNTVKLDRKRKVWYPLLIVFWLLWPKFNFWKENWALGYVFTRIWNSPNIS